MHVVCFISCAQAQLTQRVHSVHTLTQPLNTPIAVHRLHTQKQPPIIDISLGLHAGAVKFAEPAGLGDFRSLRQAKARGDICNESQLDGLSVHSGTHVDFASHFLEARWHLRGATDGLWQRGTP